MKKIILVILLFISFSSCEKDDICDPTTPTTPKLVIDFYDALNPTILKPVTNLVIAEVGNSVGFTPFSGTEIKIPLKTQLDITKYRFISNYSDPTTILTNEDVIEFDYTRNNVFISRACGFKTLFTLNSGLPIQTEPATPDGKWIQSIIVAQPNITNENEIHIKILF